MKLQDLKPIAYQHYNQYFQLLSTPNSQEFEDHPDYLKWFFNVSAPIYNGCMLKENCLNHWKERIDKNHAFFREKNIPFTCMITETEKRDEMARYLENLGYQSPEPFRFVVSELSKNGPRFLAEKPVSVKRVSSDEEMKIWTDILCDIFFPDQKEETYRFFYERYKRLGYSDSCPIWHYLGYLNNEPVGASSLLMTYDVDQNPLISGLWNGGVLEKGRKRGVGRAMASQRIDDALEQNFSIMTCILMSEAMAWTYCEPLGFKDRFKFYPYFNS